MLGDGIERKVMIVDDETDFRLAMEAFLSEYGYEVILAEDGPDALRKLPEYKPQIVFLDINMPGMTGIEVLTEIKRRPENQSLPVVMLTAHGDTNLIMQAQELNAADFMTKPFETKDILDLIQQYVV